MTSVRLDVLFRNARIHQMGQLPPVRPGALQSALPAKIWLVYRPIAVRNERRDSEWFSLGLSRQARTAHTKAQVEKVLAECDALSTAQSGSQCKELTNYIRRCKVCEIIPVARTQPLQTAGHSMMLHLAFSGAAPFNGGSSLATSKATCQPDDASGPA